MATYAAVLRLYDEDRAHFDTRVIVYDAFDMRQARRIPLAYFETGRSENGWASVGVGDIVKFDFARKLIGESLSPSYEKDPFRRKEKLKTLVESSNVRSLDELVFPEETYFARPITPSSSMPVVLKRFLSEQPLED
ncbi:MAG: hypothetical protein ABIJ21_08970 [Nanoarchaeota archaeon]